MKLSNKTCAGLQAGILGFWLALMVLPTFGASLEDNVKRSLQVSSGAVLVVDLDRGAIEVVHGEGEEVLVEVRRKASAWKEPSAQKILDDHQVTVILTNNRMDVQARSKQKLVRPR